MQLILLQPLWEKCFKNVRTIRRRAKTPERDAVSRPFQAFEVHHVRLSFSIYLLCGDTCKMGRTRDYISLPAVGPVR
jgi:hypothetical protein